MSQTTLDRISVAQLPDRYSITRSVVYNRLNDLSIKPERLGNKAYVNAQQLDLLDRLHQHIQDGGITADFLAATGRSGIQSGLQSVGLSDGQSESSARLSGTESSPQSVGRSGIQSAKLSDGQVMLVDAQALTILGEIMTRFVPLPAPLANLRAIQEACDQGWLLSTSHLVALLGVKNLSGQMIERYGFRFMRVGHNGAESAWRVGQISNG